MSSMRENLRADLAQLSNHNERLVCSKCNPEAFNFECSVCKVKRCLSEFPGDSNLYKLRKKLLPRCIACHRCSRCGVGNLHHPQKMMTGVSLCNACYGACCNVCGQRKGKKRIQHATESKFETRRASTLRCMSHLPILWEEKSWKHVFKCRSC